MTEVIMPKMGDGMEEGTLVEWTKSEGDTVKSGEVIGNIQTDKATLELEAPASGKLAGLLIQAGDTVPVGQAIGAVLKEGESLPEGWGSGGAEAGKAPEQEEKTESAESETKSKAEPTDDTQSAGDKGSADRIKASPLARKVASEAGIDLAAISGSGPSGRIVEKDVRAAIESQGTKVSQAIGLTVEAKADQKVKLNNLRRIIAERTQQSKVEAPHFYVTVEVNLDRITALRELFKEEDGGKISVNDFVVRATTLALQDMPEVNASFKGDHVLQHGAVHIGIAAAVDEGLLVPVIKNAHAMTLRQLSDSAKSLVKKARDGKLGPDEMSGSTFSISNMGMLDVDNFAAIINGPNAGILAISSARKKPVVNEDDEIEIGIRMNITGSFDHRVIDGAIGAEFVNRVRFYLENPTHLLS